MRRPPLLVLMWVAATVAATGLAWAGVSLVADQVVQPVRPSTVSDVLAASPSPSPQVSASPTPTPSATSTPTPGPTATPSSPPTSTPAEGSDDVDVPQPVIRTHQLVGGRVTIEYRPDAVRILVPAEPADGFRVEIDRDGPTELRVEFTSDTHRSRLESWWDGGARFEIDEDERDDDPDEEPSESESEDDDPDEDG